MNYKIHMKITIWHCSINLVNYKSQRDKYVKIGDYIQCVTHGFSNERK